MLILLIEDDENFRDALAANLRFDGHVVAECADTAAAPALEALDRFDAVVVDYQLPGENGAAYARRVREAFPEIPVVLITAYLNGSLDQDLQGLRNVRLLRKPFDYRDLIATLTLSEPETSSPR